MKRWLIIVLCLPWLALGQVRLPTLEYSLEPEFGSSTGDWGQFNFQRPYGIYAYGITDFRDLFYFDPVSGQPTQLDIQWGARAGVEGSLSELIQPPIAVAGDTTLPTLWVSARQGYQEFKGLNLWFHKGMTENLSLALSSEVRSQNRYYLDEYQHQIHRLEFLHSLPGAELIAGVSMSRGDLPLFLFVADSLGVQNLDLTRHVTQDLAGGSLDLTLLEQPLGVSHFSWDGRTGKRYWADRSRQEWSQLVELQGFIGTGSITPLWDVSFYSEQLDTLRRTTPGFKLSIDSLAVGPVKGEISTFALGDEINAFGALAWNFSNFMLQAQRRPIVYAPPNLDAYELGALNLVTTALRFGNQIAQLQLWQGGVDSGGEAAGYQISYRGEVSSRTRFGLGYQELVTLPTTFVWDSRRVTWDLEQKMSLFKGKLALDLSAWGIHHSQYSSGLYVESNMRAAPSGRARAEDWIHRINYSIRVQVRTVTFAFTDINMLQDILWESVLGNNWKYDIEPIANQPSENRFQYFTLIWEFEN